MYSPLKRAIHKPLATIKMNLLKHFLLNLTMFILASCSSDKQTLEIGNGNDVIVSLEILNYKGINKIELQGNGSVKMIESTDLLNYKTVYFGFEGKGEGTFKVCVYSTIDTICSEHYVEGGYRPELTCTKDKIEVKDHIGIGY